MSERTTPPPDQSRTQATPGTRQIDPVAAGRVPPQDLEAEMSLLGSMLLDKESIGLVLQIIPRDESSRFYQPENRLLFETLLDLYDQDKPIDIILLEDELRRRGQLEEIGGREFLIDLCNSVPSAANSEYYARIVRDKAFLRDLIQCAGEILQSAYDQRGPAAEVLDDAEKRLFGVTEQRVSNQAISIREFLDETYQQIESFQEGGLTGITTGFAELDEKLGGMQHGDFLVVAARPSMGKTSLGLSMLECIGVVERMPCVFFSLEMGKLQIAQRILCAHAQVDMHRMRKGILTQQEKQKLKTVCRGMREFPIFIDDTPGISVMELRAKARRLKMTADIKVIFVDYLQLMSDRTAARESRQQEISSISRGLKALARELNIPVVAMAQLNRQVEGRSSNRPRMSDLRESGAIEQDADVVMLLHREEYYLDKTKTELLEKARGKAELIIDKQRNGPTGVIDLHFNPKFARFDNATAGFTSADDEYAAAEAAHSDAYMPSPPPDATELITPHEDEEAPF